MALDPIPMKNFTPPLPTREKGLEKDKIFYREGVLGPLETPYKNKDRLPDT